MEPIKIFSLSESITTSIGYNSEEVLEIATSN